MNENRRDLMTFTRHGTDMISMHCENVRGALRNRITGRADQARVRQQAADFTTPPLNNSARPGSAVDRHGDVTRKKDKQSLDLCTLSG